MAIRAGARAATLLLGGGLLALLAGDGTGGERGLRFRPGDDVSLRLTLARGAGAAPGARIVLRNHGTDHQQGVTVQVFADSVEGPLLWSTTVDVAAGRTARLYPALDPPEGAFAVTARAVLSGDADAFPSDNTVTAPLGRPGRAADARIGSALYTVNCLVCHGADGGGAAQGPAIAGLGTGELRASVRGGEPGMPANPALSAQDLRRMAVFLRDPRAADPPPPPPDPGTPTYLADIRPLLNARCVSCHGSDSPRDGIRFNTWASASNNIAAGLSAVKAGRMPRTGSLGPSQVQLLQDWMEGGTPK